MTFAESYKRNLDKTQWLSKIASFLISVILIAEISKSIYEFSAWGNSKGVNENLYQFKIGLSFQIIIFLFFVFRFVFRFVFITFKKSKAIWFSLVSWLICWSSVFAYYLITQQIFFGSVFAQVEFHCADCIYSAMFLWTSKSLAILLYSYLLLSPIHQILHLIIAFFHRK